MKFEMKNMRESETKTIRVVHLQFFFGGDVLWMSLAGSSKCQGFAGPQLGWTKRDDLPWQWLKIWSTPNKNTPRVVIGGFQFGWGFSI